MRDLNEATPLIAAARTNALATARALLARGARVDFADEWGDDALAIATAHHHTKMMWQLKAALRGPLDRLRTSKVVFSYPPSAHAQLRHLVEAVRKVKGGEGVYGVAQDARLAIDVGSKDRKGEGEGEEWGDEGVPDSPSRPSSPQVSSGKVSWSGPSVTWLNACVRASLIVQIAPEGEEYQQDSVCQEQAGLLHARVRLENLRHELRKAEEDALVHEEDTAPEFMRLDEETPLSRLRDAIVQLESAANRLKARIRTTDHEFLQDRDSLRQLDIPGPEGQSYRDDRMEMLEGLFAELKVLEDEAAPLLAQIHKTLELRRHVMLQENIAHIEDSLGKLKAKIRPLPKAPDKDANTATQDAFKVDLEKTKVDNAKMEEDIVRREKQKVRMTAKLKDDLRTLEKPSPPPTLLMSLSARAFARMDVKTFTLWLNWQTESNGFAKKVETKTKPPPSPQPIFDPDEHEWSVPSRRVSL